MPRKEKQTFKYFAFISYSHADEQWGKWLHSKIETYRVPQRLLEEYGARDLPRRLFPLFRDREELPTSADLGGNIRDALEESRYLIVICSPRSARSRWVEEEIVQFKAMHGANRVLCFIVDGEPHAADVEQECFSEALKYRITPEGGITDQVVEPVAADARPGKDGKKNAFLKMVAGLLGVRYDSLKRRDQVRTRQRYFLSAAGSLVILAIMILLAGQWKSQQSLAEVTNLEKSGNAAISRAAGGDYARGISELHGILEAGDRSQLAEYETFYNAWINRFSPLQQQVANLTDPSLVTWRSREYFRGKENHLTLLPDGTPVVTGYDDGMIYTIRETERGKATAYQIDPATGKTKRRIEDVALLDVSQLYRKPGSEMILLAGKARSASAGGAVLQVMELEFKRVRKSFYSDEQLDSFTSQFRDLRNITLRPRDFVFPALLPEQTFWTLDKQTGGNTAPQWHSWLPDSDDPDPVSRLFAAADWVGFEADHNLLFHFETTPVDGGVTVCAMGSEGTKYGVWKIFQVEEDGLKVSKGVDLQFHGDFGQHMYSPDKRFFYIQNLQYLGHPAFDIVDLREIREVSPKKQPSGAGAVPGMAAFSGDSSHFAMVSEDGTLWSYRLNKGGDRFDLLNKRNLNNPENVVAICFLTGERLLLVRSDGKLQVIDPGTTDQYWVTSSTGLNVEEGMESHSSSDGSQFCLFDGENLQFFQGANGAPLSGILPVTDVAGTTEIGISEKEGVWKMTDLQSGNSWQQSTGQQMNTDLPLEELTGFKPGKVPKAIGILPGAAQ